MSCCTPYCPTYPSAPYSYPFATAGATGATGPQGATGASASATSIVPAPSAVLAITTTASGTAANGQTAGVSPQTVTTGGVIPATLTVGSTVPNAAISDAVTFPRIGTLTALYGQLVISALATAPTTATTFYVSTYVSTTGIGGTYTLQRTSAFSAIATAAMGAGASLADTGFSLGPYPPGASALLLFTATATGTTAALSATINPTLALSIV